MIVARARGALRLGAFAGLTALHGARLLAVRRDPERQVRVTHEWGRAICRALGIRIDLAGACPREPALLVANHRSYADICVVAACTPVAFVAKTEVASWPVLGPAAARAGTVFVTRGDAHSGATALRRMRALVAAGISIAVFPEGTTHAGPGIGEFQRGAFRLAAAARIPIAPVAIEYARVEDAWIDPGDLSFVPHFLTCFARREVPVRIAFGPPLAPRDASTLHAEATRWITAHLVAPHEREGASGAVSL